jgi:hypothetical protein
VRAHASPRHAHRDFLHRFATCRQRLTALVKDGNAPQRHVWRAEIIRLSAVLGYRNAS